MQASDRDYIADMLENAEFAIRLLASDGVPAVAADRNKFAALCHFVQTIGEAANQVSAEGRSELAEVPWQKMIGMRHHLVHGYRTIVADLVVGTIRDDLPALLTCLRRALEKTPP